MQDLFELTPELLLEQSQQMTSLCADYENLFANISSDLKGANDSWSDLLAHNFAGKISSAQKAFTGALSMMRTSAQSIRTVAQTAQEMDTMWASKISGTGMQTDWPHKMQVLMEMDENQRAEYVVRQKDMLELLKKLEEQYEENVPPSVREWIKLLGEKGDKAFFDKNMGQVDELLKVLGKIEEGDYRGAFKTGGKTILKELFKEGVKGTAGEAINLFGYKYDPTTKYYINVGLGIGEGIGEFVLDPSLENFTEIAWNASVGAVLKTAGSSIETVTRLIPGISEYYYDEHGAEDIEDASAVALGDLYGLFCPDEDIKEYASNYYKDGVWEGLWGGFEDIASFVKDSGGPAEAAKSFFGTAWKDSQENFGHVAENAEYLWKAVSKFIGGAKDEPIAKVLSGGGAGAAF